MSIKKRCVAVALAASIASMSVVGCFGQNALHGKYTGFVGSLGDKWVSSIVYFFTWHWVGGFCLFADFLIFNTLEFWTGSNPIAMGDTYEDMDENGNKIYAVKNSDGTLTMNMTAANGERAVYIMERAGDKEFRLYNGKGELLGFHTVR